MHTYYILINSYFLWWCQHFGIDWHLYAVYCVMIYKSCVKVKPARGQAVPQRPPPDVVMSISSGKLEAIEALVTLRDGVSTCQGVEML